MRIRIRSDRLIFGLPDPHLFSLDPDPDPTCNNGFIKLFSSWTNYKPEFNKFKFKMMVSWAGSGSKGKKWIFIPAYGSESMSNAFFNSKNVKCSECLGKTPTIITVSRSSEDDYCPPNQVRIWLLDQWPVWRIPDPIFRMLESGFWSGHNNQRQKCHFSKSYFVFVLCTRETIRVGLSNAFFRQVGSGFKFFYMAKSLKKKDNMYVEPHPG